MSTVDLRNNVAIVTGAGRGIGRAIAQRLAKSGASVVAVARTLSQITETCSLIKANGGTAIPIAADVTQEADVSRLVEQTIAAFGRVDVLVNNAGVAPLMRIEQTSTDDFDTVIATNVRAVFLCCRAVWAPMAKAGSGAIVNISSVGAFDPFPGFAAYGAAKAFVNTYTKALAAEGAERNIRVYAVAPGAVETTMLRGAFPDFPTDKVLAPDDVAALVEALLAPACQHSCGQTVIIQK
ncbi:MAG: SDR family oxidoreductase [Planctomycetes bacterium]|nr:SDR family oxidoreductase [Planctomycetota bacterium]